MVFAISNNIFLLSERLIAYNRVSFKVLQGKKEAVRLLILGRGYPNRKSKHFIKFNNISIYENTVTIAKRMEFFEFGWSNERIGS